MASRRWNSGASLIPWVTFFFGSLAQLSYAAIPSLVEVGLSAGIQTFTSPVMNSPCANPVVDMMGGGLAVGDFNRDGRPDFFVLGRGVRPDALYINQGNGQFVNQAAQAGVARTHCGSGVAVADYDNDGHLDIYITSFGVPGATSPGQHLLYRNLGNLRFEERAAAAGVNQTSLSNADGFGAAWGDFDLDGHLDLMVTSWIVGSGGNILFRNNGNGTFSRSSALAGVGSLSGMMGFTPCFVDMNGDRYPELVIAGDFGTSRYFINNRNGTFSDATPTVRPDRAYNGMGGVVADFNNDGVLDWYISAIFQPGDTSGGRNGNKLLLGAGSHAFDERASTFSVDQGGWGWGVAALDLDNDGWLDLLETNGWFDGTPGNAGFLPNPKRVWLNLQGLGFTDVATFAGFTDTGLGRGLAALDFDGDGKIDFLSYASDGPLRLYRNATTGINQNWLRINLNTRGVAGLVADGLGALITIRVNGQKQVRSVNACQTYLSQGEMTAHFGLGAASVVDEVTIDWANGQQTRLVQVAANQLLTVGAAGPQVVTSHSQPILLALVLLLLLVVFQRVRESSRRDTL